MTVTPRQTTPDRWKPRSVRAEGWVAYLEYDCVCTHPKPVEAAIIARVVSSWAIRETGAEDLDNYRKALCTVVWLLAWAAERIIIGSMPSGSRQRDIEGALGKIRDAHDLLQALLIDGEQHHG